MARLLFLIADTGGGHRASATAVARYLGMASPGQHEIHIVDPFTAKAPPLVGRTAGLYGPLTRRASWLWGALWYATNSRAAVSALVNSVLRLAGPPIRAHVAHLRPDAIVSFHPLLNHVAARVARVSASHPVVITVITDLVDVHASWACREVDAVVVPSPGGYDRCRRAGITAGRCYDLGLPVDATFTQAPLTDEQRVELRRRLGLPPDGFVLLICSGADGSGRIVQRARAVAAAGLDVDIAVICGRNKRAYEQLRGARDARGRQLVVRGFVDNMAEWMRAADVVATKAGPGTITEALCSGVPLLLTSYLPGQERGNVEWVSDIGAGRYVPRNNQLVDAIAALAGKESPRLATMRKAVRLAARPDATRRIAELIEQLAERPIG